MIVIEQHYDIKDSRGGGKIHEVIRKAFPDDAVEQVNAFLEQRPVYDYFNLEFIYTKL